MQGMELFIEPIAIINQQLIHGGYEMLGWTLLFLVVALLSAVLGFSGVAATSASIAQVLFFVFIVLFLLTLVMGVARRGDRALDNKSQ